MIQNKGEENLASWLQILRLTIVSVIISLQSVSTEALEAEEVCRWEAFNATCSPDGVVLMASAHYGRMREGRCLETDFYIGCSKDVLLWVDELCSGRMHCVINVPHQRLHEIQPCPKDFQAYLEASYECVSVETAGSDCHETPIQVSPKIGEGGYLSSTTTDITSQGSANCPWLVRVEKGQRINVTLLDFNVLANGKLDDTRCYMYATIKEKDSRVERVCGGKDRIRNLYLSSSNELQITIIKQTIEKERKRFLIKYQAVGCPDFPASESSWMERKGDHLTIGCNCTDQTWHLVCKDTKWIGDSGLCQTCQAEYQRDAAIYPYGLLFSIVIGVVLGIFLGVFLLAILLTCRRRRSLREERTDYYVDRANWEKQANFVVTSIEARDPSTTDYAGFINPSGHHHHHHHHLSTAHGLLGTSPYTHIVDSQPAQQRGRNERDTAASAKTMKLAQPLRPALAAPGPAGAGPCCVGSSGRVGMTLGRLYDSPVVDSGHQSKASTASYGSDAPVYNDVASPE